MPEVIIAEPDGQLRDQLGVACAAFGYGVKLVSDGNAVLALVARAAPQLLVVAEGLPLVNAADVLSAVAAAPAWQTTVVAGRTRGYSTLFNAALARSGTRLLAPERAALGLLPLLRS